MEEMLETPFYHQDDILSRSIPPSILYDKHSLDLNLQTCSDLSSQQKQRENGQNTEQQAQHGSMESPNLDFLKLGSPDLERMFMNLQGNVPASPSDDSNAAFSFTGENLAAANDNSFAEALQQLHDQQENVTIVANTSVGNKVSPQTSTNLHIVGSNAPITNEGTERRQPASRPKKQHVEEEIFIINNNNNNNNNNNHNIANHNNNHRSRCSGNNETNFVGNQINTPQPQVVSRPQLAALGLPVAANNGVVNINGHMIPQEQFIMNNMAVLGNANHHMLPPQMQQEIAFLNHAMGFIPERDGIPQAMIEHVTMADPTMQFRHLQARFQDGNFVEAGFPERAQMQVNGIDNVQMINHLDEQTKLFLENNPHYQPIDLELQELVKRERKKLRNRVASSKCRKRKLEREARLDIRVKELKEKNIELGAVANALKQQVCDLKQRVMDHVNEGCQIVLSV
uniref:Jun3 n=1 Tax=Aurelia aurita TaxID=6145 RepID=A0A288W1Q5_AURAU|nr:Jun3 [Aurelia aurita]